MNVQKTTRSSIRMRISLFICLIILPAAMAFAQKNDIDRPERFMSRAMKHIPPEQGIRFLAQVGLGTASRIPNTNTILVTAKAGDLVKARTLLELVDSKEPYSVVLLPAEQSLKDIDWQQAISEQIKDIPIGSFSSPPAPANTSGVLVDILNDLLIVAAPANQLDRIVSEIESISQTINAAEDVDSHLLAAAEPNTPVTEQGPTEKIKPPISYEDQNQPQVDKFFEQLVNSLEEAEKIEAELKGYAIPETKQTGDRTELPLTAIEQIQKSPKEKTQPEAEALTELIPETVSAPEVEAETEIQPSKSPTKIVEIGPAKTAPAFERLSYEPEHIELANEELELDLPEKLNIVDLIDLVGKYLNLDLLYDTGEVKGFVTLRVQDKVRVGELYPLLESVLRFRGFVMSRRGNLVTIVPDKKVNQIDPLIIDTKEKKLEYGQVVVTRVFNLRYIDTQSAKNLLDEMDLGTHIKGISEANKLVVTGYAYRMSRIEELLAMVDQPGKMKQFRYRQLRFTMAQNLASQVKTLAEQLGTVSVTISAAAKQVLTKPARIRPARTQPQPKPAAKTDRTSVYLDADERTNRILMIGMPEQLDIVETLIDSLDVAQQDLRTLRLYDIQYVGAEEVIEKLAALGVISSSQSRPARGQTGRAGRITPTSKDKAAPQAPAQTIFTEEGLAEEPQVVIIESTNSLLVNATAEQHAGIATIIAYVDAEPEQAAINYVVYPLENQDPEELAAVLNQLVQETIEETKDKDSKIVRTTTRSRMEEDITIIPDAKTYSLVVYASRKNQQWISSLIRELDEYRPQVLLETTLVEITQNEKFEYDIDIIAQSLGGASLRSNQVGSELEDFTTSRYADFRSTTSATDSVIKAFFNSENIQALLTAIQQKGYGRIMARPKILVNDNQEGEIKTQNTISVAQVKSNVVIPDQGSAVTTKDVSFKDYEAGVTLTIKPHISKGDMLRLEITLNRTDFTLKDDIEIIDNDGKQTFPSPPDRLSTDITTVGTIPNGTTIILGGLETIDQSKGHSKVPILGDLPLVGGLFRGVTNAGDQSRLYVFVKANIIRPGDQIAGLEDIKRVSSKNRRAFEEMEDKFQRLEDWPGIKPKPMDPIKILEAD